MSFYDYFDYFVEQFDAIVSLFTDLPDTLHDMLLDLHHELNNELNPTSEDNIDSFNTALQNFNDNTFVGSVHDIADSGSQLTTALGGSSPNAHLYVNTLPVSFFGAQIPAKQIDINMEWYGAYRTQTFTILRAFMYLGFFVLIIRALPSLLGGTSPIVQDYIRPDIEQFENITIDDDGVVSRHSTTSIDRHGNRTTQVHRGRL